MVHTFHPYFDPSQAATFNEIAIEKDSTFEFRYFPFHGYSATTHVILAASGAKFSNIVPIDWFAEKPHTPFGVMPLLREISADGKTTINIAESDAIERYLAEKFGMAGDNAFERTVVNSYASNSDDLIYHIYMKFFTVKDPSLKAEAKEKLLSGPIAAWIKYNEQHLAANGSNGHYIGNKITIADIKAAHMVEAIRGVKDDAITDESAPALLKVKATIDSIPSVKAWKATDEFKTFSEGNLRAFGFA